MRQANRNCLQRSRASWHPAACAARLGSSWRAGPRAPLCLGDGSPGHEDKGIQISGPVRMTLALAGAPWGSSAREEACVHGGSASGPQRSTRACATPRGNWGRAHRSQETQVNGKSKARNMGTRRNALWLYDETSVGLHVV